MSNRFFVYTHWLNVVVVSETKPVVVNGRIFHECRHHLYRPVTARIANHSMRRAYMSIAWTSGFPQITFLSCSSVTILAVTSFSVLSSGTRRTTSLPAFDKVAGGISHTSLLTTGTDGLVGGFGFDICGNIERFNFDMQEETGQLAEAVNAPVVIDAGVGVATKSTRLLT